MSAAAGTPIAADERSDRARRRPRDPRRALVLAALLVAPAAVIAGRALFDPAIALLPPSLRGTWVRHVAQDEVTTAVSPAANEAVFRRDFELPTLPSQLELSVRAFGDMQVTLNDRPLAPGGAPVDWKRPTRFDIASALAAGRNRLAVRVRNSRGIPLLLVDDPPELRTPTGWRAARGPSFDAELPVVDPFYRPPRPGPLQTSTGWPWMPHAVVVWIVGIVATVAVVVLRMNGTDPDGERRSSARGAQLARWAPLLPIVTAAAMNVTNVMRYPTAREPLDWAGHLQYVRWVAEHWSVPQPTSGWEMYQPPLYYFLAAAIQSAARPLLGLDAALTAVQLLGAVAGAGLAAIAWAQARLVLPHDRAGQFVATAFAALVPMSVYMAPVVTNETLAAAMIALAIYALLRALRDADTHWSNAALAGVAAGAAMLAKFTAVFALTAGLLALLWRAAQGRARAWTALAAYAGAASALSGWFYARNLLTYGTPFVGNWDDASGFAYVQEPSFRTLGFFLRFGGVFFQHPTRSIWGSWLDGIYATMWADSHSVLFDQGNGRAYLWMSLLLVVAFFPTAIMGLGLARTLGRAFRNAAHADLHLVLLLVCSWTWLAMIWFALKVPGYSTVKACFFLSLVPTLGVFLADGRRALQTHLPIARPVLDAVLVVTAALVVWTYRIG